MFNLRKCYFFRNHVLVKKQLNVCIQKDVKPIFSVIHTSAQKFVDPSQSDQSRSILVYEAPLKTRIKIVKFISLSSTMLGFGMLPVVIMKISKTSIVLAGVVGTTSTLFLSTPFILNWITKRYVIELHFDSETKTFTAKTLNIINQIKEIKFQASDVTVPDLPGMLSSFSVNGQPLFVDANMIQHPDAYSHMMGYDKPLDFTLESHEQSENTKT